MAQYADAVQAGSSALAYMLTGSNAESRAAYNAEYQRLAHRANVLEARQVAQSNLAAIEQDKILSNTQIRINQSHAEAQALVSAAAAGVDGGSVDDVIYDTERNAAFALSRNNAKAEQEKEYQVAAIGSQSSELLAIPDRAEYSSAGAILEAFSSLEQSDLDIMESGAVKGLSKLWSK
jgi:hypothetical protein